MRDKFNKYCAGVMGYVADCENRYIKDDQFMSYVLNYNPYDNLNQMADVFDKKWCNEWNKKADGEYMTKAQINMSTIFSEAIGDYGIKQAMRDFIISTMPEDKDSE